MITDTTGVLESTQNAAQIQALDETEINDNRPLTPENSQQPEANENKDDMILTPTRKKNGGSILKDVLTPNSTRNRVVFSENHLEITTDGDKSVNKLIPDTKDTRTKKRRLREAARINNLNSPSHSNISSDSLAGATPAVKQKGFISRGLAMFQAATNLSPLPSQRNRMAGAREISPHRMPLRKQIFSGEISPQPKKRQHLDEEAMEVEKRSPVKSSPVKSSLEASPLKTNEVRSPLKNSDKGEAVVLETTGVSKNDDKILMNNTLVYFLHNITTFNCHSPEKITKAIILSFNGKQVRDAYIELCKKLEIKTLLPETTNVKLRVTEMIKIMQSEEHSSKLDKLHYICSGKDTTFLRANHILFSLDA